MFAGWFRMRERCQNCGLVFQREPGFYLGAIYFNYGLTALAITAAFFGLYLGAGIQPDVLLWPLTAFCVLFPLWFFRYARALWLGFDQFWDPRR